MFMHNFYDIYLLMFRICALIRIRINFPSSLIRSFCCIYACYMKHLRRKRTGTLNVSWRHYKRANQEIVLKTFQIFFLIIGKINCLIIKIVIILKKLKLSNIITYIYIYMKIVVRWKRMILIKQNYFKQEIHELSKCP